MKKYLLLRDNRESGPFSLTEIAARDLYPDDLLWIEGESKAWSHPTEIPELKKTVRRRPAREQLRRLPRRGAELRTRICQRVEDLQEKLDNFKRKGPVWNRTGSVMGDVIQVAAVFAGVICGAFLIKKMADGFDTDPSANHPAVPTTIIVDDRHPSGGYRNALLTETMLEKVVPAKAVKKPRPTDIMKELSVRASPYRVGLLGGISNLELSVYNSSPHTADKVTLAVQYLKKNGAVIHTDHYELFSIRPQARKSIKLPDSRRGMKLRFRIVEVNSKDYSRAMKEV